MKNTSWIFKKKWAKRKWKLGQANKDQHESIAWAYRDKTRTTEAKTNELQLATEKENFKYVTDKRKTKGKGESAVHQSGTAHHN